MRTSKLVIGGVGVASGVLLAAWLLTGTRKEKTKKILTKSTETLKRSLQKERKNHFDDSEVYYI
jgi:hypothetical protein